MPAPLLEVENLTHVYHPQTARAVRALEDVSFTVAHGEFVAIIGGNGSGKSTLARHLNALLLPTGGRVRVDGLDTAVDEHLWEIRRRVGMVFQNPDNQLVTSIVEEDVAFGPENLGVPPAEIRVRVDAALAAVRMSALRERPPHLLSGGQKQRVAIAGILALRPSCIVFDEATTMLDPAGQREVMESARCLRDESGITIIAITHNMDEAATADRILVLHEGRLALDAPPRQLFTEAARLRALRLDLPEAAQVADGLRRRGVAVEAGRVEIAGLAEAILALAGRR
ncbi:MAG: energy-coupling factor transporter ATPase [Armatimonadetes bacterium]|nr:energy-coupling factor transporter ATPase [Armatimonadota bacterium]